MYNPDEGSYECHCIYGWAGDGFHCHIVRSPDGNCVDDICEEVECKPGFIGDGHYCRNYDECTWTPDSRLHETDEECTTCAPHQCVWNAECTDTWGSYTCECDTGYSGNGNNCSNDNECIDNTDNCDVNASCTDTEGSFTCSCNDGYVGDGTSCNGTVQGYSEIWLGVWSDSF